LKETERVQALLGRFNAEDENPFFSALTPASLLPPRGSKAFLKPNSINMNDKVRPGSSGGQPNATQLPLSLVQFP